MAKKDILLKAQREGMAGVDEGTKQSRNQGRFYGRIGVDLIFVVIALTSLLTGASIPTEASAMFFAGLGGDMYAQWRNQRNPINLVLAFVSAFVVIGNLVLTIRRMMGAA